jgi:LPS export ABC transporter protein LptC
MYISEVHKIFSAVLITGCIFLCACENNTKEVDQLSSKRLGVEEAKNVDINYSLGGKARAKLLSPQMFRVQDTIAYVEFPKTLHVDFYNPLGGVDSKLDALYGKYYETQSRVFLKDSVTVTNDKGDTLHCDELWWDRTKTDHEFYTEKPVRIKTKTQIIYGIGMDARQDFKNWHILEPRGFVNVPASDFPTN